MPYFSNIRKFDDFQIKLVELFFAFFYIIEIFKKSLELFFLKRYEVTVLGKFLLRKFREIPNILISDSPTLKF